MVNFVKPDFLGEKLFFKFLFEKPISDGKRDNCPVHIRKIARRRAWLLHNRVKPLILRRDMSLLKASLPRKYELVVTVRLSDLQRQLYKQFLEVCAKKKQYSLFWMYDVLSMLCNHPDIVMKYKQKKEKEVNSLMSTVRTLKNGSLKKTEMELEIKNKRDAIECINGMLGKQIGKH